MKTRGFAREAIEYYFNQRRTALSDALGAAKRGSMSYIDKLSLAEHASEEINLPIPSKFYDLIRKDFYEAKMRRDSMNFYAALANYPGCSSRRVIDTIGLERVIKIFSETLAELMEDNPLPPRLG